MATELQPARGTHDLIGEDQRRYQHMVDTARRIAASYGFDEWATPIFEDTRVFSRTLGETSDVVMKEMYTFEDRGGDSITLRPEFTAGVCRALVSNGLTQSLPQKVFLSGPVFRYDRPQKGRFRQFHQLDLEVLGSAEPLADAEVIACGWEIIKALGIAQHVVLELNTLGRQGKPAGLSRRARRLFHRAPRSVVAGQSGAAGSQPDAHPGQQGRTRSRAGRRRSDDQRHLTEAAARFYAGVKPTSSSFGVPFRRTPASCAGSTTTATPRSSSSPRKLGAQDAVGGGGRYDGLVAEMGGPAVPASVGHGHRSSGVVAG